MKGKLNPKITRWNIARIIDVARRYKSMIVGLNTVNSVSTGFLPFLLMLISAEFFCVMYECAKLIVLSIRFPRLFIISLR